MTAGTAMAFALPRAAGTALTAVLVLATAVWVGGLVAIFVVARVARATLRAAERVAFFRGLGRAYGLVGGIALTVALAAGAILASTYRWDGQLTASAVVAAGLVAAAVAGVAQARRMTRLRQHALRSPGHPELAAKIRRGARNAAVLRAAIAALSLTLLALGTVIAALCPSSCLASPGMDLGPWHERRKGS
ncbi:MAG: hypothetical protein ACRDNF_12170 [Streptosporangiaceae bacterium]